MSHRITYESKITDRDLAIAALDSLNMAYHEQDGRLLVTSGSLHQAVIDLSTGKIDSDTDYHSNEAIDRLKIAYTEASTRREYARTGVTIISREVVSYNGVKDVVLLRCRRAFG